jgi:hypothetical protein
MSMNLAYELATAGDDETKEILDNTILLLIPSSNPDGIDIVANWYRKTLGTGSEGTSPPELYHHYAGHDNNRDWFMLNLRETQAITKLYWQEWFPPGRLRRASDGSDRCAVCDPRLSLIRRILESRRRYCGRSDSSVTRWPPTCRLRTSLVWRRTRRSTHGGMEGFVRHPYYHNSVGILSEAASADLMSPVTVTKEQMQRSRPSRGLASPLTADTAHPDALGGRSLETARYRRDRDDLESSTFVARVKIPFALPAEFLRTEPRES